MDHVIYVIFTNQILCFGLAIYTFYCSSNVLFRKKYSIKTSSYLSATLVLYFLYIFLFAFTSIGYFFYFFILWRFDTVIYDGRVLYLLGIIPFICTSMNSFMEWILCLDRCFAVYFNLKYTKQRQTAFLTFAFISISAMVYLYVSILIAYFPSGQQTKCRFFGCFFQGNSNMLYIKGGCILLSLITAILFAFLIKKKFQTTSKTVKRINKTILIIICLTTINEFIPYMIGQICFWVTGNNISVYTGPFGSVISQITVTLSAGIYYNSYKKIANNSNNSNHVMFLKSDTRFTTHTGANTTRH